MKKGSFIYLEIPGRMRCILRLSKDYESKTGLYHYDQRFEVQVMPSQDGGIQTILVPTSKALGTCNSDAVISISDDETVCVSTIAQNSDMYRDLVSMTTGIALGGAMPTTR